MIAMNAETGAGKSGGEGVTRVIVGTTARTRSGTGGEETGRGTDRRSGSGTSVPTTIDDETDHGAGIVMVGMVPALLSGTGGMASGESGIDPGPDRGTGQGVEMRRSQSGM